MKIKRSVLRTIINESMTNLHSSIEVDWAGNINDIHDLPMGLTATVVNQNGPGGWATVDVRGPEDALRQWYVNDYSGGAEYAEDDFYEFYNM